MCFLILMHVGALNCFSWAFSLQPEANVDIRMLARGGFVYKHKQLKLDIVARELSWQELGNLNYPRCYWLHLLYILSKTI